MSQSFNDSFNNDENNQSNYDMQNVKDFELQEMLHDGNAEDNQNILSSAAASSDDSSSSVVLDENIIKEKINAVKDFSFCTQKTKKGEKKIPIFPYVVALTGHRDAKTKINRNDNSYDTRLVETARTQLLELVKSWSSATLKLSDRLLNRFRITRKKYIKNKSVPLIVLIGLDDENSGRFWADIASELRDIEHYNIKIVAVSFTKTSVLFKTQKDHKNDFKEIFDKADGLIELPYNNSFIKPVLENIEKNARINEDDALEILLRQKRIEEYQYTEYLKFVCLHSHTIISLTENAENWKTANLTKFDISAFELDNDTAPSSMLDKINVGSDYELYEQISKIKRSLLDNIGSFFKGDNYVKKRSEERINTILDDTFKDLKNVQIPRTDRLIQYKLLGRLNPTILPLSPKKAELTFTAIGPVICIDCDRLHKDNQKMPHTVKESDHKITVLIKDRYGDTNYNMIYSEKWERPFSINHFPEIKSVVDKLGKLNREIFDHSNINTSSVEQFLEDQKNALPSNIQKQLPELDEISIPHGFDSLVQHFHFTDQIAINYGKQNRSLIKNFCWRFAILLVSVATLEFLTTLILKNDKTFSLKQLIYNFFDFYTFPINVRICPFANWTVFEETLIAILLIPFTVFFLLIIYNIGYSVFFKPHVHYHKFRTLAELLRIQLYWRLAEMDETVPGNFHSHQSCNLDWVRAALNGLDLTLTLPLENELQINNFDRLIINYRLIHKLWIGNELYYFSGLKDNGKNNERPNIIPSTIKNGISKIKNGISKLPYIHDIMRFIILAIGLCYIASEPFGSSNSNSFTALWIKWGAGVFLSIIACYTLHTKLSLSKYKSLRNEQSLFPFRRAYLLMGIRLLYCEKAKKYSEKSKKIIDNPYYVNLNKEDEILDKEEKIIWLVLSKSNEVIHHFLRQLGRISIGKKADWYLCVNERELTIPKR